MKNTLLLLVQSRQQTFVKYCRETRIVIKVHIEKNTKWIEPMFIPVSMTNIVYIIKEILVNYGVKIFVYYIYRR